MATKDFLVSGLRGAGINADTIHNLETDSSRAKMVGAMPLLHSAFVYCQSAQQIPGCFVRLRQLLAVPVPLANLKYKNLWGGGT
jgi:hypothetical protein